jgi:hypothetical protein
VAAAAAAAAVTTKVTAAATTAMVVTVAMAVAKVGAEVMVVEVGAGVEMEAAPHSSLWGMCRLYYSKMREK